MRFLITAQPGPESIKHNADEVPDLNLIARYMKFNEDLTTAGVLVTAEGLNPFGARARIEAKGGKRKVVDGPFAESKELLGGFYLIDVASKEEAVEWALRCPTGLGTDDILEVHQMTELTDLPEEMREIIRKVAPAWSSSIMGVK